MLGPLSLNSQRELNELLAFLDGNVEISSFTFRTSPWGRAVHLLMVALGLFIVWAFLRPVIQFLDAVTLIIFVTIGLPGAWLTAYSIYFALGPSLRFTCSNTHLVYSGMFRSVAIPWDQIKSFEIERQPKVILLDFLMVKVPSIRRRRFRFNATGTRPSEFTLRAIGHRMMKIAAHASDPDQLEFEQELAALKEGKLDAATRARIEARTEALKKRLHELQTRR